MKLKQLESCGLLVTEQRYGRYVAVFIPVDMFDGLHLLVSYFVLFLADYG